MREETVTRTYTCKGDSELMDRIDKFLLATERLGNWGASRRLSMFVDGDGADRLSVKGPAKQLAKWDTDATDKDEIKVDSFDFKEHAAVLAEKLIDQYLEQKSELDSKFNKQLVKGQRVKKDALQDIPHRDTNSNSDQDITWASSSTAPYR